MFNTSTENSQNQTNVTCGGKVFADLPPQAETQIIHKNNQDVAMIQETTKKETITFSAYVESGARTFETKGQVAKTLLTLVKAGNSGCTVWCFPTGFRLASYINILKKKYSLVIKREMEKHPGGSHARYRLVIPVEIISVK